MYLEGNNASVQLTTGQTLVLAAGGLIDNNSAGFFTMGIQVGESPSPVNDCFLQISGDVRSDSVKAIGIEGQGNELHIAATGTVVADTNNSATNGGAVYLGRGGNRVENDGTIYALFNAGINHMSVDAGENTVINRGLVVSVYATAIFSDSFANVGLILQNSGTIRGGQAALDISNGADRVTNTGLLSGDVKLNGGNDWLDSRSGRISGLIDAGAGNDTIRATSGNDEIRGGEGADLLTGGAGADVFLFETGSSFVSATTRDRITDFRAGQDKLDLIAIDAIAGGVNDAFRFIGTKAFTGAAQARFVNKPGETWVELNLDADKTAEMRIVLNGKVTLTAGDFLL